MNWLKDEHGHTKAGLFYQITISEPPDKKNQPFSGKYQPKIQVRRQLDHNFNIRNGGQKKQKEIW